MAHEYDLLDLDSGQFDGQSVSEVEARALRTRRTALGQRTIVVPVAYREPKVSREEALRIATDDLHERAKAYPNNSFQPVELFREHPLFMTFISFSPEWKAQEIVPGGLTCSVDRVDGHVWTMAESERYAETQAS